MLVISIIINNYNYGRFLGECVESVLGQTVPAHEVIVVDDGSTDDSREILHPYRHRLSILIQENAGQAAALNRGFAAARGEWILFLDADDYLFPEALATLDGAMRPHVTRIHYPLERRDRANRSSGTLLPAPNDLAQGNGLRHFLKHGHHTTPPMSGNLFSRHWLDSVLPIPADRFRLCADLYLAFASLATQESHRLNDALGVYRVHGANAFYRESTFAMTPALARVRLQAIENMLELLQGQLDAPSDPSSAASPESRLNLRQLKELLLAGRLLGSEADRPVGRESAHRAILAKLRGIPSTAERWQERVNLLLLRFAPLGLLPWVARLEAAKKRLRAQRGRRR
jgi:hypothetical protein